jgi:oxygen-dependent protoporphyrinogen oxidase
MVEALVENLKFNNVDLRLNTRALRITQRYLGFQVQLKDRTTLETDSLILATPAYVSGQLLASLNPQLAFTLQSIPYVSTATVSLAYRLSDVPRELDGYGYVIPRREGRKALACTWTSTKFPHRAPEGYALIRVFAGRAGQELPRDEKQLLELAKEELRLTLGITAEPLIWRAFMWEKAMPQYNLGHPERLKRIDAAMHHHPDLALAGNGYHGIGIPDCIHSGELAVERILKFLHFDVEISKIQK